MRPSWQIDLKWIAGLAACLLVLASGVLFSLSRFTERDSAVPLASAVLALGINERVSDEDYAQVQAAAAANSAAPVSLSPLSVTAAGSELAGLNRDQGVTLMANRLAGVLYDDGSAAAKQLIVDPPPGSSDEGPLSLGPTGSLTSDKHTNFQKYFWFSSAVALLLIAVVVFMSRGFGRLGSAALVLAIGTGPLALFWTVAGSAVGTGDADESVFLHAARLALRDTADDLRSTFGVVFLAAAATVMLALTGGIMVPLVRRFRRGTAPAGAGKEADAPAQTPAETPPAAAPEASAAP